MAGLSGTVPGCVRRLAGAKNGKDRGLIRQIEPSMSPGDESACTIQKKPDETLVIKGEIHRIMVPVIKSRATSFGFGCGCLGYCKSIAEGCPKTDKACGEGFCPKDTDFFRCIYPVDFGYTGKFCCEACCVDAEAVKYNEISLAVTEEGNYISARCKSPPFHYGGIVPQDEHGLSIFKVFDCDNEMIPTCECEVRENPRPKQCRADVSWSCLKGDLTHCRGHKRMTCAYYAEPACFGESTDLRKLEHNGSGYWRIHVSVVKYAWVRCVNGLCLTAGHAVRTEEKGWTTWGEHTENKQYTTKFERVYNLVGAGGAVTSRWDNFRFLGEG